VQNLTASAKQSQAPLRARNRLRLRKEIASAAIALFQEHGYDATSVEDIATAVDCSASTVFRLVGSKQDAIFFDVEDRLDGLRRLMTDMPPGQPWRQIRTILLETTQELWDANAGFELARVQLWHMYPALASRYFEVCLSWEELIAAYFARARGTDPDADPYCRLAAGAIISAVRAAYRAVAADCATLPHHLEPLLDLLEVGLSFDVDMQSAQ
jgi:AcrR family transcriptional regulator